MKDSDCINYLFSLQRLGTILGLERISFLLKELGNPQNSFKSIHIAGTNGKGSVSTMLSCILQEYGFKTGLYTSPHMKRFGERIRINSIEIPDKELVFEIKKIKKIVDKKQKKAPYFLPTFFEFAVAIAYDYFARKKAADDFKNAIEQEPPEEIVREVEEKLKENESELKKQGKHLSG